MKEKLTKEQIRELVAIASTANVGTVVNLSCFGRSASTNTRANRAEQILPNVHTMVVLGEDGKFSPLTEDEQVDMFMKIFNHFWLKHLDFMGSHFAFIGGLQDDFFTQEMYFRLLDYAKIFFENRLNREVVERNHLKYTIESERDKQRIHLMEKEFEKALYRKMKEISATFLKRKKDQRATEVSLLQQLVANNLAWQDAQTVQEDGTSREIKFTF